MVGSNEHVLSVICISRDVHAYNYSVLLIVYLDSIGPWMF